MLRRLFGPLATPRPWRETAHLLLDLPAGVAWFTIVVTLLATSVGLIVTLLGLPLLALTVRIGRWIGAVERGRASLLLDDDVPAPPPVPLEGSAWQKVRTAMADATGWRGLLYGVVMLPVGIVTFTVTVLAWSLAAAWIALPAYAWALPDDGALTSARDVAGVVVLGVLMLAAVPRIVHALTRADRALVGALLSR